VRPPAPAVPLLAPLAFALSASPAAAHGAAAAPFADPERLLVAAMLVIAAVAYAVGTARIARRSRRRGTGLLRRPALFAAGMTVTAAALLGPLPDAARDSFTAHMIEHELLMVVAAPLLVLARPLGALAWGLPGPARQALAAAVRAAGRLRGLARPGVASLIHAAALWIWHMPVLFEAADRGALAHALQHASFFGSALLFWHAMLPAGRTQAGPSAAAALHLAVTSMHAGALGALFVFAGRLWYPGAVGAAPLGLDPMEDQALAGLVMWVVACAVYVIAALALLGLAIGATGAAGREHRAAGAG
jgi:putative membrane protein